MNVKLNCFVFVLGLGFLKIFDMPEEHFTSGLNN
jgi:hypothetical protein